MTAMRVFFGAVMVLGMTCGAALAEGVKIGYVDLEKAFNEFYRTKEENAKLQDLQKAKKSGPNATPFPPP